MFQVSSSSFKNKLLFNNNELHLKGAIPENILVQIATKRDNEQKIIPEKAKAHIVLFEVY